MARIVAVINLKGGIGKTTTVVNVSAGLALKGARVLLIDIDARQPGDGARCPTAPHPLRGDC